MYPPQINEYDRLAHEQRQGSREQLVFALVTGPIMPCSAEYKFRRRQYAIQKQVNEHESRSTRNLNSVMELDDLQAMKKSKSHDVIIGSVCEGRQNKENKISS